MKIKTFFDLSNDEIHAIAEAFRMDSAQGCDKALKIISKSFSVIYEITRDIVETEKKI
jgi:hypothetical protein